MSGDSVTNLKPLAPGIILALLSIAFGFILGGSFGAAEDSIKGHLRSSADVVFDSVYEGDANKRDAVVSKSWSYMKRAHLHGGAIGAAALASIVLLGLFGNPGPLERYSALAFGAGSFLYPMFWLAAGLTAPSVGSTGEAKEALGFLAIPGAGLCLLGIGGTLASVLRRVTASED
ncbi:MAG: hypothetical protein JRG94_18095 [Deltaproteobacteria bacterium]|jgi:hypothetical protein|nr:hypothetical protein [Deltaproteobacteria bacterium]